MNANILSVRQQCDRGCSTTYWRLYGTVDRGDVRRCQHGRLWYATGGGRQGMFYSVLDAWEPLSWYWTPILWMRARRVLQEAA